MGKAVDREELARLIGVVESKLAQLPQSIESAEARAGFHQAAEDALSDLARTEGARVGHGRFGGHHSLRLAAIQSTCTYGAHSVMRNWVATARRRLEVRP